eukprot:CFRG6670T1
MRRNRGGGVHKGVLLSEIRQATAYNRYAEETKMWRDHEKEKTLRDDKSNLSSVGEYKGEQAKERDDGRLQIEKRRSRERNVNHTLNRDCGKQRDRDKYSDRNSIYRHNYLRREDGGLRADCGKVTKSANASVSVTKSDRETCRTTPTTVIIKKDFEGDRNAPEYRDSLWCRDRDVKRRNGTYNVKCKVQESDETKEDMNPYAEARRKAALLKAKDITTARSKWVPTGYAEMYHDDESDLILFDTSMSGRKVRDENDSGTDKVPETSRKRKKKSQKDKSKKTRTKK